MNVWSNFYAFERLSTVIILFPVDTFQKFLLLLEQRTIEILNVKILIRVRP